MMECDEADVEFASGSFSVRGTSTTRTLGDIVLAAHVAHDLPEGMEPGMDADAFKQATRRK